MRAMVRTEQDVTFVQLVGYMDMESVSYFRKYCSEKLNGQKVVINMTQLSFVGSSGIFNFMEVLRELRGSEATPSNLRLCGGGPEFRRIFQLGNLIGTGMFEDELIAARSFFEPNLVVDLVASPAVLESWDESEGEMGIPVALENAQFSENGVAEFSEIAMEKVAMDNDEESVIAESSYGESTLPNSGVTRAESMTGESVPVAPIQLKHHRSE